MTTQRLMLVAVLALGAVLPVSLILVPRSGGGDLGGDVGASIGAFDVRMRQPLVSGPVSTQVRAQDTWTRVASLDGDDISALAHTDDLALALTARGLLTADVDTLRFAPWDGSAAAGADVVGIGAGAGTLYLVADTGITRRVDVGTGRMISISPAATGAPVGRIAVDGADASTAWGVDADARLVTTDDGGTSWVEVANRGAVVGVALDEAVPGRLGVLDESGVLLSADAGVTWDRIDAPPDLQAIAFDDTVLYAVTPVDGRGLVFELVDGTWTVVS